MNERDDDIVVFGSTRARTIFDIASIAIIIAGFAWMIHRGWGTWADPIYNTGRELHIAEQVASGRALYRDIAHLNGPFSAQVNAQIFRTFGARAGVLTIANLTLLALLVAMIWWLWRRIADPLAAGVACVVLLIWFALAPGSRAFNYALPFEHEATHGVIASFAALCALAMYLRSMRARWMVIAGCLLGVALLTKFGLFLSALLPIIVGLSASLYAQRAVRSEVIARFAALLAPILGIGFVAFSLLSDDLPIAQKFGSMFGSARWTVSLQLLAMPWYQEMLGTRSIGRSFDEMLVCGLAYIALFAPPFAVGVIARRHAEWRTTALVVAPLFVLAVLFTLYDAISWQYAFRGLSLVTLALAIGFGANLLHRKRTEIDGVLILRLTVVWFALILIAHLGLRAVIFDYGVVFAMPAALVAIAAGMSWIPAIADRGGGFGWPSRAAVLAAVLVLTVSYVQRDNRRLTQPTTSIGHGMDTLKFDDRGKVMIDLLRELRARAKPGDTMLVAPDGAMLNHFSGLPNPTPYFGLMPPEIVMFGGQERVRDTIAKSPPDWFVLTSGGAEAFGFKSFAVDYGAQIWQWIEPRYEKVATVGDARFGMQLYRRRSQ